MIRTLVLSSITLFGFFLSQQPGIAQTLSFELQGMAGPGITAGNEPGDTIDGGTGGLGPNGISVNLSTGVVSIDVVWGSKNGFTDLSSDIDFMNIHGPTSQVAGDNFAENGDTFAGLSGFDASASSGGYAGDTDFSGSLAGLLEGRYYVHLHTIVNNGGEARGYMIPEVVVGDVNNDGIINLLDVGPFVDAISSGEFVDEADTNRDGVVNLLDITLMITLLSG